MARNRFGQFLVICLCLVILYIPYELRDSGGTHKPVNVHHPVHRSPNDIPPTLPAPVHDAQKNKTDGPGSVKGAYNYCEGGPSENALSAASPLVSDCRDLIDILKTEDREDSRKWTSCRQHQLVAYHTCVFGIETIPNWCFPWTTLETGDGDIIDWIQDSIDTWGAVVGDDGQERVGTWGISECHNIGFLGDDYLPVKWGLYHSEGGEDEDIVEHE